MLSDRQIKDEIQRGNIFCEPFFSENLGPNSIDVSVGNWFVYLLGWKNKRPIYDEFEYVPSGCYYELPEQGTVLGMTLERIGSRGNIVQVMGGRSTSRRSGLRVCDDAGRGDVGYYDQHWAMEFSSELPFNSPEPVSILAGVPISRNEDGTRGPDSRVAQICFYYTGEVDKPYNGQYQAHDWPLNMLPKIARADYIGYNFEDAKIRGFKKYGLL